MDYDLIRRKLNQARFYIKLHRAWTHLLYSALVTLSVIGLTELAFRIFVFDGRRVFETLVLTLLLTIPVLLALFRKVSDFECAKTIDLLFDTKERLSTSVELKNQKLKSKFSREIISDAAKAAANINPSKGFSYKPTKRLSMTFIVLVLVNLLLFYLPNPGEKVLADRQDLARQLEIEKKALINKKAEISKDAGLSEKDKKDLLKKIEELARDLSKNDLSKEEAIAKISKMEEELNKKRSAWGKSNEEILQRLARRMSGNTELQNLSTALQNNEYKKAAKEAGKLSSLKHLSESKRSALASEFYRVSNSVSSVEPQLAKALSEIATALSSKYIDNNAMARSSDQLSQALKEAGERAALEQILSSLSSQLSQSRQSIAQSGQQSNQMDQTNSQANNSSTSNQSSQSSANSSGRQASGGGGGSGRIGARPNARSGTSSSARDFGNVLLNRDRKSGKYNSIYAPDFINARTKDEKLTGNVNQGEETLENVPLPPAKEEALIPYTQAYYHYYDTAVEALNRSEIPPSMQEVVKNYFQSLSP